MAKSKQKKQGRKSTTKRSSTKKSRKSTIGSDSSEAVNVKNPNIVQDKSVFTFPNGDTYNGCYRAIKTRVIYREGTGSYITKENDVYKGEWVEDKLLAPMTIKYQDGASYTGQADGLNYSGTGEYTYIDGTTIKSDFKNNRPKGLITLRDPNMHCWFGQANEGGVTVVPMNRFLLMDAKWPEARKKGDTDSCDYYDFIKP